MKPAVLTTSRLVLDQPGTNDRDLIVEYCRDPLFEVFLTTPWPYEPKHAEQFVTSYVPDGWTSDREYTWALRTDGVFAGVIGYREATRDIGYWIGGPHRGRGLMTEASTAVIDWLFSLGRRTILWECVPGNQASAAVARKTGFTYSGTGPSALADNQLSWHASLAATDTRNEKPGWP